MGVRSAECCIQYTHQAMLRAYSGRPSARSDSLRRTDAATLERTNAPRLRRAACRFRSSTRTSTSGIRRRNYYPWLRDEPPIPFRYGDYRADPPPLPAARLPRRRRARSVVEKSVYVETEWDPRDPVGEMRYIESLRREHGLPSVAVAQAWLDRDDAPQVLERTPRVRLRAQRPPQAARQRVARATPRPAA